MPLTDFKPFMLSGPRQVPSPILMAGSTPLISITSSGIQITPELQVSSHCRVVLDPYGIYMLYTSTVYLYIYGNHTLPCMLYTSYCTSCDRSTFNLLSSFEWHGLRSVCAEKIVASEDAARQHDLLFPCSVIVTVSEFYAILAEQYDHHHHRRRRRYYFSFYRSS